MSYENGNGNGGNAGNGGNGGNRGDSREGPRSGGTQSDDATKVYIAAARSSGERERAKAVRTVLHAAGYKVTSSWIDEMQNDDQIRPGDRAARLKSRTTEIGFADAMVFLTNEKEPGDSVHYVEFAYFLRYGRPVVWSTDGGGENIYSARFEVLTATDDTLAKHLELGRKMKQWKSAGEIETKKKHNIRDDYRGGQSAGGQQQGDEIPF
jgi:hypothetical protein